MITERRPRRDAVERRARIIEIARDVLLADPDATLETIAAAAGLTRRTIYGHVASREALIAEVIEVGAARIAGSVDAALALAMVGAADVDPADRESNIEADPALAVARLGAALWDEVGDVRASAALAVRDPHRGRVAELLAPVRSRLRDIVAIGSRSGRFRDDLDAEVLARLIERAAIAVLDEAAADTIPTSLARRLVMIDGLAIAGLDRTDAAAVADRIDGHRR